MNDVQSLTLPEQPLRALSLIHTFFFLSLPTAGFSAECQAKIDTLIPAVRRTSRRNRRAPPPWRTASTTTAPVAPPTPAGATVPPWMDIRTGWTRLPSTPRPRGWGATGRSGNGTMTAPAPLLKTHRPSANICWTPCPKDCVWCAVTLHQGTTMEWPPARPARLSSRGQFKVGCFLSFLSFAQNDNV